jgi:hypothetical protein
MGAGHDAARPFRRNHRYHEGRAAHDTEVNQVARVKRITGSEYQVTMTGTELALIRTALGEVERVSRFGMKVLDEADRSQDGKPAENRRLHQKIDAFAIREASLRSLRKALSEIDHGGTPTPTRHAAIGQPRSAARPPVPLPRWKQDG